MAKIGSFDFYCGEALPGKTKVKKLYESDKVLAFYHTKPAYKTHIVIIPKEHLHDLQSLEEKHKNIIKEIMYVARDLSKKMNKENEGVRLITNLGKFQDSPHLHFHLISGEKIK